MSHVSVDSIGQSVPVEWSQPGPLPPSVAPLVLAVGAAVLVALGVAQDFYLSATHAPASHKLWLLDLDAEYSLLSWYSAGLMLVAAVWLADLADAARRRRDRFALQWLGLGLVFVFLSADETLSLHEKLSWFLKSRLHPHGALYPVWVAPMLVACAAGALVYVRFLRSLAAPVRNWILAAAAVYVTAAAGFEMVEGPFIERHEFNAPVYRVLSDTEEALEVCGLLMFLYALSRARREGSTPVALARAGRDRPDVWRPALRRGWRGPSRR
jgi:hypothetical protein